MMSEDWNYAVQSAVLTYVRELNSKTVPFRVNEETFGESEGVG